jgi:uncharacterized membrane protein YgaE (UPF0421/DUF939 family)
LDPEEDKTEFESGSEKKLKQTCKTAQLLAGQKSGNRWFKKSIHRWKAGEIKVVKAMQEVVYKRRAFRNLSGSRRRCTKINLYNRKKLVKKLTSAGEQMLIF